MGDTAQRQCLVGVGEDLAVDLFTFRTDQGRETEIVDQEIIGIDSALFGVLVMILVQAGNGLYGYRIDGFRDRLPQAHGLIGIGMCIVVDFGTAFASVCVLEIEGTVILGAGQCVVVQVQRRRVSRDDLEGGTGLTGGAGRAVEYAVGGFLSPAADQSDDIAGILVLDGQRDLRLDDHAQSFAVDLVAFIHDFVLILLNDRFRLILGVFTAAVEKDLVAGVGHCIGVIVGGGSVRMADRQRVAGVVVGRIRIVVGIRSLFIRDSLDGRILCGMDDQAAAVDQLIGLGLGIADFLQIGDDLICQGVYEVGVDFVLFLFLDGVGLGDPFVYILCIGQGLIILLLADHLLVQHFVQDHLTARLVLLRVGDRVILGRVLGNGGKDRAFGKAQVFQLGLVEITVGSRADTQCGMSQVDGVEVVEQDDRLGVLALCCQFFFQLDGQILLLDLSADTLDGILSRPFGKDVVLDQLLGDGTGTLTELTAGGQANESGTGDAVNINTVVAVETLILNGDERVGQHFGHAVHRDTVGVGGDELGDLFPVGIEDDGVVAFGDDIRHLDIGRRVLDALESAVARAGPDDDRANQAQNGHMCQEHADPVGPPAAVGPELFQPFLYIALTVVHIVRKVLSRKFCSAKMSRWELRYDSHSIN